METAAEATVTAPKKNALPPHIAGHTEVAPTKAPHAKQKPLATSTTPLTQTGKAAAQTAAIGYIDVVGQLKMTT